MLKQNNTYWIKSIQSGKCLDICQDKNKKKGTAILYDYVNAPNQQFILRKTEEYYILISSLTGKVLSIEKGMSDNGAVIREDDWNNSLSQKWKLVETGPFSEQYFIVSALSNKVLDVCNEKKGNGTAIFLYDRKGSHNQIWQFIHADDGDYPLKLMGSKNIDKPSSFFGKPF